VLQLALLLISKTGVKKYAGQDNLTGVVFYLVGSVPDIVVT
jgi:hypothetical protein